MLVKSLLLVREQIAPVSPFVISVAVGKMYPQLGGKYADICSKEVLGPFSILAWRIQGSGAWWAARLWECTESDEPGDLATAAESKNKW